jgi:hypothetical protein
MRRSVAKPGVGLSIDESAFAKKGTQSVKWRTNGMDGWGRRTTARWACSARSGEVIESFSLTLACICRRNGLTIQCAASSLEFREQNRFIGLSLNWRKRLMTAMQFMLDTGLRHA